MQNHYINLCWHVVNWTLRTNFKDILIKIHCFWYKKSNYKMSPTKWRGNLVSILLCWYEGCPWCDPCSALQWRHNEHDGVSNYQPHDCLLNCLFRRRSKKISKLHVTGLCAGNLPVTGKFTAQMDSTAENVSIWWRHHDHIRNRGFMIWDIRPKRIANTNLAKSRLPITCFEIGQSFSNLHKACMAMILPWPV